MAFDASQEQSLDDEQKNQANQPSASSAPLSGGGSGFAGNQVASGGQSVAGSSQDKPSSSGSWTNLNTYLDANRDQSTKLGSDVAGAVGNQAQQAQGDLSKSVQGFQSQAPYQTVNNTSSDQIGKSLEASQYANGGDPTQAYNYLNGNWGFSPSTSDLTQYQGGAGGPGYGTVSNEYKTTDDALKNTQTEAGRKLLLQDQYGHNGIGYNNGDQLFDQLLLQQNPDNQSALNGVYQQYAPQFTQTDANGVRMGLSNAITGAQAYDTAEKAKGQSYQQQAQQSLMDQVSGLGTNVQGEIGSKASGYDDQYQQLKKDLTGKQLTSDEAAQLGITGGNIYNLHPETFLGNEVNPYTGSGAGNYAANANDWNQFQGLQKLISGIKTNDGFQGESSGALDKVGLTGTQPTNAPSNPWDAFQSNAYKGAVTSAQGAFDQAAQSNMGEAPNPTSYQQFMAQNPDWQKLVDLSRNDPSGTGLDSYLNTNYSQDPGIKAQQSKMISDLSQFLMLQGYGNKLAVTQKEPNTSPRFPGVYSMIG